MRLASMITALAVCLLSSVCKASTISLDKVTYAAASATGTVGSNSMKMSGSFTATASQTGSNPASSASATVTGTQTSITYLESTTLLPSDLEGQAEGTIFFSVNTPVTYSFSNERNATYTSDLDADEDHSFFLYGVDLVGINGIDYQWLSNGSIIGSSSGVLLPGSQYRITAITDLSTETDPTLTYNPTISFGPVSQSMSVTPEASSFVLLGTGLVSVVGFARKRFA